MAWAQLCEVCSSIDFERHILRRMPVPVRGTFKRDGSGKQGQNSVLSPSKSYSDSDSIEDTDTANAAGSTDGTTAAAATAYEDDSGLAEWLGTLSLDDNNSLESKTSYYDVAELGSAHDIMSRAAVCEFCALIVASARRIDGGKMLQLHSDTRDDGQEHYVGEASSAPLEFSLKTRTFCMWRDIDYDPTLQEKDDFMVNHLIVEPKPNVSFQKGEIRFQPYREVASDNDNLHGFKGLGRMVPSSLDIGRLKGWIHECETSHGVQCERPPWVHELQNHLRFRLIDVERRCVVVAPIGPRYLALSYVWGTEKTTRTTTANLADFEKDGGLDHKELRGVIADAMSLVARLNEKYLWADAYCIVQDDPIELQEQISQMDKIFSGALLTIIAAGGSGSEDSIPGMGPSGRVIRQGKVKISENLSLMQTVAQERDGMLQFSKWNTRGWTHQERLLSRRALIFTEYQVFWICEQATWTEENILEPSKPNTWILGQALACNDEWADVVSKFSLNAYSQYVVQYSHRQLTSQSDALAAFSGILRCMERHNNTTFYWALREATFDQELAWSGGHDRRRDMCKVVVEASIREVHFPSWSWLGWREFVSPGVLSASLKNTRLLAPLLDFYKLGVDGSIVKICQRNQDAQQSRSALEKEWMGSTSIEGPVVVTGINNDLTSSDNSPAIVQDTHIDPNSLSSQISPRLAFHDTGRLVFWTSHARLVVRPDHISSTWNEPNATAEVGDDSIELLLDNRLRNRLFYHELYFASPDSSDTDDTASDKEDVVDDNVHDRSKGRQQTEFVVISRNTRQDKVENLNLLAIEWSQKEAGVASRRGLARVAEKDWIKLKPEWKMVILR